MQFMKHLQSLGPSYLYSDNFEEAGSALNFYMGYGLRYSSMKGTR